MITTDLNNQYICIVGFGKEGQAVLQALHEDAPNAKICIADANESIKVLPETEMQTGEQWLQNLDRFDAIIVSPGIPPCAELDAVENKCTNSTALFLAEVLQNKALVIGVTGTKGKSTTSSLIAHILKHCQKKPVHLLGNIGTPSIAARKQCTSDNIVVLEMSSYQLLRVQQSPQIAVITSFFEDHLDYHTKESSVRNLPIEKQHNAAVQAYKRAKMKICQFQTDGQTTFFDTYTNGAHDIAAVSNGMTIATSAQDCPVSIDSTKLHGEHNIRNMALATVVCEQLGCETERVIEALKTFTPLPHRLQSVGIHHGIEWIDDAISTTAQSTIAALDALGDRVRILILGGQDRGIDFTALADDIVQRNIEHIVLLPDSGERIRSCIENAYPDHLIQWHYAHSMQEVVEQCIKASKQLSITDMTPIALLSTASPSYNMFKNFEDKGEQFAKYIKILDK